MSRVVVFEQSGMCALAWSLLYLVGMFVCTYVLFFFQAEDGIRDYKVTGVQTCALPISKTALAAIAAITRGANHGAGCVAIAGISLRRAHVTKISSATAWHEAHCAKCCFCASDSAAVSAICSISVRKRLQS